MEQPKKYKKTEIDNLVTWLKYDLKRQKDNGIKEIDLVMNIGSIDNYIEKKNTVEISFDFDLKKLIQYLTDEKIDENKQYPCPFIINCNNVYFKKTTDFNCIDFQKDINFSNAIFHKQSDFHDTVFRKSVNFTDTVFNDYVYFWETIFNTKAIFLNTTFNDGAGFSKNILNKNINFNGLTINKNISFSQIEIEDTLTLDNLNLNDTSYILFHNINYDSDEKQFKDLYKNSKIEIINTKLNGRIDFQNVKVEKINFINSKLEDTLSLNRINFEATNENEETTIFFNNVDIQREKNQVIQEKKLRNLYAEVCLNIDYNLRYDLTKKLLINDDLAMLKLNYEFYKASIDDYNLHIHIGSVFKDRNEKEKVGDFLLNEFNITEDIRHKADIIQILGNMRNRHAKSLALEHITSPVRDLRYRSVIVLGWVGDPDTLATLNQSMLTDSDGELRCYSATAMLFIWFNYPETTNVITNYIKDAIENETDTEALSGMITTIQDLYKKKFGVTQSKYGDISGDIVNAKTKTIKFLSKV